MTPSVELDAELRQAREMARTLDEQFWCSPGADPAKVQVSASDAFGTMAARRWPRSSNSPFSVRSGPCLQFSIDRLISDAERRGQLALDCVAVEQGEQCKRKQSGDEAAGQGSSNAGKSGFSRPCESAADPFCIVGKIVVERGKACMRRLWMHQRQWQAATAWGLPINDAAGMPRQGEQATDHGHGQRALAVEHFVHAMALAATGHYVRNRETCLIYAELDRFDRARAVIG